MDEAVVRWRQASHILGQLVVDAPDLGRGARNGRRDISPELLHCRELVVDRRVGSIAARGGVQLPQRLAPGAIDRWIERECFHDLPGRFLLRRREITARQLLNETAVDRRNRRADGHVFGGEKAQEMHHLARFGQRMQAGMADAQVVSAAVGFEAEDDIIVLADPAQRRRVAAPQLPH